MFFLRLLFLVLMFTIIGLMVMFFPRVKSITTGTYHFIQGQYEYDRGHLPEARQDFELALRGYPDLATVFIRLGDIERALKHPNDALSYYQKALDVNPKSKEAMHRLAESEEKLGRLRLALGIYADLLKADPKNIDLWRKVGTMYYKLGKEHSTMEDYDQAITHLLNVVAKEPEDMGSRFKLAESYFNQERYTKALGVYCDLAIDNPQSAEALYSLAVTLAHLKAHKEAAEMMVRATEAVEVTQPELSQPWAAIAIKFQQAQSPTDKEPPKAVTACMDKYHTAEEKRDKEAAAEAATEE